MDALLLMEKFIFFIYTYKISAIRTATTMIIIINDYLLTCITHITQRLLKGAKGRDFTLTMNIYIFLLSLCNSFNLNSLDACRISIAFFNIIFFYWIRVLLLWLCSVLLIFFWMYIFSITSQQFFSYIFLLYKYFFFSSLRTHLSKNLVFKHSITNVTV